MSARFKTSRVFRSVAAVVGAAVLCALPTGVLADDPPDVDKDAGGQTVTPSVTLAEGQSTTMPFRPGVQVDKILGIDCRPEEVATASMRGTADEATIKINGHKAGTAVIVITYKPRKLKAGIGRADGEDEELRQHVINVLVVAMGTESKALVLAKGHRAQIDLPRGAKYEEVTVTHGSTTDSVYPKGGKSGVATGDRVISVKTKQGTRIMIKGLKKGVAAVDVKYRVIDKSGKTEKRHATIGVQVVDPKKKTGKRLHVIKWDTWPDSPEKLEFSYRPMFCPRNVGALACTLGYIRGVDGDPLGGAVSCGAQARMPFDAVLDGRLTRYSWYESLYAVAGVSREVYQPNDGVDEATGWTATAGLGAEYWLDFFAALTRMWCMGIGVEVFGMYRHVDADLERYVVRTEAVMVGTCDLGLPIYEDRPVYANGDESTDAFGIGTAANLHIHDSSCRFGFGVGTTACIQSELDLGRAGSGDLLNLGVHTFGLVSW